MSFYLCLVVDNGVVDDLFACRHVISSLPEYAICIEMDTFTFRCGWPEYRLYSECTLCTLCTVHNTECTVHNTMLHIGLAHVWFIEDMR